MRVFEKFRESLSPEDFTQLEEAVTTLIEEKAKVRAELIVEEETKRLETLAEEYVEIQVKEKVDAKIATLEESYEARTKEFKETAAEKLQEISEKYVETRIADELSAKIVELEEAYEAKFEKLNESVVDNIDRFIESEISEKISSDLIKNVAINEAFKPIVAGIMGLFEAEFVPLDVDGNKIVEASKAEVKELEAKINSIYKEKMQLTESMDELKTKLLISEKVSGMTSTQKERVITMFEGKCFDEVSKKIGTFVELLEENDTFDNDDSGSSDVYQAPLNESVEEVEEIAKPAEKSELEIRLEKVQSYL